MARSRVREYTDICLSVKDIKRVKKWNSPLVVVREWLKPHFQNLKLWIKRTIKRLERRETNDKCSY